jgi:acyl-CoA synthetase (AMP-forming)/AMP-acid ligase II
MRHHKRGLFDTSAMAAIDWIHRPSTNAGFSIADDDGGWKYLSYQELADLSARIGGVLRGDGLRPGRGACVVLPSSHLCVGTLYAVWVCGATLTLIAPPVFGDPTDHTAHLSAILRKAQPHSVVTSPDLAAVITRAATEAGLTRPPVLLTDDIAGTECPVDPARRHSDCALVQFTSGSTSSPRGVMVSWDNLDANLSLIASTLSWAPGDAVVSWLPLYHDMGLIGGTLNTVARQGNCYLLRPDQFIRDPARWLRAMANAQHSLSPSFGLGYTASRVRPEDITDLDLSGWRSLVTGAEPVDVSHLHAFCALVERQGFSPRSIVPAYGLAEATLMVTGKPVNDPVRALRINSGSLRLGSPVEVIDAATFVGQRLEGDGWITGLGPQHGTVRIVDEAGQELPNDTLGHIVVSSASVAMGYRGEDQSDAAATTYFADEVLHTGDAGFCSGGQLFVLGRMGTCLKVRGKTVFMEDVEARLAAATGISKAKLCGVAVNGTPTPGLALFVEQPAGSWVSTARRTLRSDLGPAHTLQVIVGPRGLIRRTSSGKPRRKAMWHLLISGELPEATVLDDPADGAVADPAPRTDRRIAISAEQLDELLSKTLGAVDVDDRATILLEGSLAEGFGNTSSDIDFLAIVPGDADTPSMPTVLFIDGYRTELRTRSLGELQAQLQVAATALAAPEAGPPNNDILNRCQRFLRAMVVRPGDETAAVKDLQTSVISHDDFGRLMRRWWLDRAQQSLRQAVAAAGFGAVADAHAWARDGLQQAAKAWAAGHRETYLETKWLAMQLLRAGDQTISTRYHDLDTALAEGAPNKPLHLLDAALELASELGVAEVVNDPSRIRFSRVADVTTWQVGQTLHVIRGRQDVFVLSKRAAAAWRSVVFGHPITEAITRTDRDEVLAEFVRLGLVALQWYCDGKPARVIQPALAMCDPARPYSCSPSPSSPPLAITGAVGDREVSLSPLPARRLAECAMNLIWSNIIAENAREDLLGAIKSGQVGVADVVTARLIGVSVRVLLSAFGVAPLPPDVAALTTVGRVLPSGFDGRRELLDRLRGALKISFVRAHDVNEEAPGFLAELDDLVQCIRHAANSPFPASFNSPEEWRRTLDLGYDWLRLGSYLNADIPLDEARDLLTSGGIQPHVRSKGVLG